MKKHTEYAKKLVEVHGHEKALEMVQNSLKICSDPNTAKITYYDEADFSVNSNGQLVLSKRQTVKKQQAKERRVKGNINFYYTV